MATRVRKLARELRRTPAEVLGLLHELGYVRYRTTEDQVSDLVASRVREAVRQGVQAAPVQPVPVGGREAVRPESRESADWMGKLVPGVVRRKLEEHEIRGVDARQASVQPPRGAERRDSTPRHGEGAGVVQGAVQAESTPQPVVERARLEVERAQLEAARTELLDAQAQLERARAELADARQQVEQMRMDLEEERIELEAVRARADHVGTPLVELLEERGLRGADEQQRALAALASGRHLSVLLGELHVLNPGRARRVLDDRLVLVGGAIPEALQGVGAITVAPDRAELPDARELERLLAEIGEQLLLLGLRRLVVVNAAPRWRRLLRDGLDARIDLAFFPAPGPEPEQMGRLDALALWRVSVPASRWSDSIKLVVEVSEPSFYGFLLRLRDRLRAG